MKTSLSDLCKKCGACCKCLVLPVPKPLNKAIFEDWLDARGCEIVGRAGGTVYVKIDHPCPHLNKSDEGYKCDQYFSRPEGCRMFDGSKYPFLNCAWKKAQPIMAHVVLEKSGGKCPIDGSQGVLLRRYKEGVYWVREYRCRKGHIFSEQQ
jgi:Fe-S-cluster containining protein